MFSLKRSRLETSRRCTLHSDVHSIDAAGNKMSVTRVRDEYNIILNSIETRYTVVCSEPGVIRGVYLEPTYQSYPREK